MDLTNYITSDRVVFLEEPEKSQVIRRLVEKAARLSLIRDQAGFEAAVKQREAMSTTGIGMGLAIPHGRCRETTDFFIIPGIARRPVEWQAIDYAPVRAVFLIGIPDIPSSARDTTGRYLEIIAALMLLIKDQHRREALFSAASPEELIAVLSKDSGPPADSG